MKFRSRRLLTRRSAEPVCRLLRSARLGRQPKRDDSVERFLHVESGLLAAPVPKVASRTIKDMFRSLNGGANSFEEHIRPDKIRACYPDYFIFSFVRNPWDRIHSCWKDKIDDAVTPGKISILSRFPDLYPFMPFEEFVEWLATEPGSDASADRHWLSQTAHLTSAGGESFCDYIGRIEEYEEHIREIERRAGCALPRPPARNVQGEREGYESAYSARGRQIIASRYAGDIERFGYRFA